jgi:hypothetical protein
VNKKFNEIHPAALAFNNMLTEVRQFVEKYEERYIESEDMEIVRDGLELINQRLFDLQMERFSVYINERGNLNQMPEDEETLLREMTDLTVRINKLLHDD